MWGLGFSRMVLENAIATNKRLWASGESNCDCVEKKKERARESEREKKLLFFDNSRIYFFFCFMNICMCHSLAS